MWSLLPAAAAYSLQVWCLLGALCCQAFKSRGSAGYSISKRFTLSAEHAQRLFSHEHVDLGLGRRSIAPHNPLFHVCFVKACNTSELLG